MARHEFRDLEVELTSSERRQKQEELLSRLDRIDELEEERRTGIKRKIESEQAAVDRIREALKTGVEERPVECQVVYVHAHKRVSVIRLDTGDTVETRDMTEEEIQREAQGSLPMGSQKAPKKAQEASGPSDPDDDDGRDDDGDDGPDEAEDDDEQDDDDESDPEQPAEARGADVVPIAEGSAQDGALDPNETVGGR